MAGWKVKFFVLFFSGIASATLGQKSCEKFNPTFITHDDLNSLYLDKAIILFPDGKVISSPEDRSAYVNTVYGTKEKLHVTSATCVEASPTVYYEFGDTRIGDRTYGHITILKKENTAIKREFELLVDKTSEMADLSEIDQRRKEWIRLCNNHDAYRLVSELYDPEAVYYNHSPVVVGTEDIADTYSYMNRESYSLHLEPIEVAPVNGEFVFEIGQCSGSYNGNYLLIWRKTADGTWKVLFDSNI